MGRHWSSLIAWLALVGCGSVTDVGNPTLEQLVGVFQVSTPSRASTGGTDSPAATEQGSATCQSDATTTPQIAATGTAGQIRLVNFLSYSDATADVTAAYDAALGTFTFSVSDGTANVSCEGSATASDGAVSVALTCAVTAPTADDCSISYQKVE